MNVKRTTLLTMLLSQQDLSDEDATLLLSITRALTWSRNTCDFAKAKIAEIAAFTANEQWALAGIKQEEGASE